MDSKTVARGFAVVECDYLLELIEKEIERTSSITERLDLYRSSQIRFDKLWAGQFAVTSGMSSVESSMR